MSLNSLQDNMSRRAASMAAMAKRAKNPQEIQAIQKSLVDGVQNGSIQPYVGIPLIQELTQRLTEVKTQMAQSMAGAGMPQGQQGTPIAQQVMQQAAQESQGLEALPSNLPQEYAGGGIIAFEGGGEVERYQNQGIVPALGYEQLVKLYRTDPALAKEAALRAGPIGQRFLAGIESAARAGGVPLAVASLGTNATLQAGHDLATYTTPEQRRQMANNPMLSAMSGDAGLAGAIMDAPNMEKPTMGYGEQMGNALSFFPKTLISAPGDKQSPKGYGLTRLFASDNAPAPPTVKPTATPAAEIKYDPTTATRRSAYSEKNASPATPAIPGAGNFKLPTLETYTPTAATLPERAAPVLTDLGAITKDMDKKTKTAAEAAVKASQAELEAMDKPGFEARESRLGKREAAQEKDSAIGRALNLMSLGFGIAGSKERTVAGALGNEGRQGIRDLIQGEAANRAAKDKLEDYRDNLEQQKIAAKKGNYQAAQAAGERAADNLFKYTNLNVTASHYGNTEANQRFQIQQTGDINRATVGNQREQLNMSAVEQRNRNVLGLSELGLKEKQLNQNAAFQTKQLEMMKNKYASLDPYQAAQLRAKAEERVDPIALRSQLSKQLGLSKVPAPGADKGFDSKFDTLYQNEVATHFNRFLGIGGGGGAGPNPYDGFKLVP